MSIVANSCLTSIISFFITIEHRYEYQNNIFYEVYLNILKYYEFCKKFIYIIFSIYICWDILSQIIFVKWTSFTQKV